MASRNQSKDQKRKAKLAERDKRSRVVEVFQPYPGKKYQSAFWLPVMFATEEAIYNVVLESNRTLTNAQVKQAVLLLIEHLRSGGPAAVGDGEIGVEYSPSNIVGRLFFKIRQAWRTLKDSGRETSDADLTGILRTLLGSIENQALRSGASRGYVTFLEDFIPRIGRSLHTSDGASTASELVELFLATHDDDLDEDE